MTYTESLKSGHIAVWNENKSSLSLNNLSSLDVRVYSNKFSGGVRKLIPLTNIYAVNAINQMIDSARD